MPAAAILVSNCSLRGPFPVTRTSARVFLDTPRSPACFPFAQTRVSAFCPGAFAGRCTRIRKTLAQCCGACRDGGRKQETPGCQSNQIRSGYGSLTRMASSNEKRASSSIPKSSSGVQLVEDTMIDGRSFLVCGVEAEGMSRRRRRMDGQNDGQIKRQA